MKLFKTLLFLLLITCFFAINCKEQGGVSPIYDHSSYFPINAGKIQIFYVKAIRIDAGMEIYDTTEYYFSVIPDTVYDNSGVLTGEYTIFKGNQVSDITQPYGRMIRELTAPKGRYIEVIDNCREIKSRLPVEAGNYWNAHILCSTSGETGYSYINKAHAAYTLNLQKFDSVIHAVHVYDSSLIHLNVNQEVWAANKGMVYKEITDILSNSANMDPTLPIRKRITAGSIIEIFQIFEE